MFKKIITIFIISILISTCFSGVNAIEWDKKDTIITTTTVPTGLVAVGATGIVLYNKFFPKLRTIPINDLVYQIMIDEDEADRAPKETSKDLKLQAFKRLLNPYDFRPSISESDIEEFKEILRIGLSNGGYHINRDMYGIIDEVSAYINTYIDQRPNLNKVEINQIKENFVGKVYELRLKNISLQTKSILNAINKILDLTKPVRGI